MLRLPWIGGSAPQAHHGCAWVAGIVLFQTGCGSGASFPTFAAEPAIPLPTPPNAIVAADFDGDGDIDVIAFGAVSFDYQVFENVRGRLVPRPRVPLDGGPLAAVAADFDEDGILDVAVTLPSSRRVAILRGTGDLTFAETSSVPLDTPNEVPAARPPRRPPRHLPLPRLHPRRPLPPPP